MNRIESREILKILLTAGIGIVVTMLISIYQPFNLNPLFMVAGIVVVFIVIYRFYFGLLLMVAFIPVEVALSTGTGGTLIRFMGFLVFGLWVLDIVSKHRAINFSLGSLLFIAYSLWALLSVLWSNWPSRVLSLGATYLQLTLFMVILIDQINSYERLRHVIYAFLAGGVVAIVLGYMMNDFYNARLVYSDTSGTTLYGYPLSFVMAALAILALFEKSWKRLLAIGLFLLGLYPVFAIGLRGGVLAILFGVLVGAVLSRPSFNRFLTIAALGLGVYFVVNFILQSTLLPQDLIAHFSIQQAIQSGGSGRDNIWTIALQVYLHHPLLGVGLNQFPVISAGYILIDFQSRGTHNDFLNSFVELGIPGGLLILSCMLVCLTSLWKTFQVHTPHVDWRQTRALILCLFMAAITGMNFAQLLGWKAIWFIFTLAIVISRPQIINNVNVHKKMEIIKEMSVTVGQSDAIREKVA